MLRDHLDRILNGKKSYDARGYPTDKRATIALVDTKESSIVGSADLIGVHQISADEYCKWHVTCKWEGMSLCEVSLCVIDKGYTSEKNAGFKACDYVEVEVIDNRIILTKTTTPEKITDKYRKRKIRKDNSILLKLINERTFDFI